MASTSVPVPLAGTVTVEARATVPLVKLTTTPGVAQVAGSVRIAVAVSVTVPAAPHATPLTVAWIGPGDPAGTITVTPVVCAEPAEMMDAAHNTPANKARGRFTLSLPMLCSRHIPFSEDAQWSVSARLRTGD